MQQIHKFVRKNYFVQHNYETFDITILYYLKINNILYFSNLNNFFCNSNIKK
jgi:hypothetical protein